ncbi:hypothetical protein [Kitasatospora sp. NPDC087314]|uniref:hypothetical protein n=1 Tax=Kitasatospora sp. NPDC087314 TaxID=3364068 RepID=UPI00381EFCE4
MRLDTALAAVPASTDPAAATDTGPDGWVLSTTDTATDDLRAFVGGGLLHRLGARSRGGVRQLADTPGRSRPGSAPSAA